MQKNVNEVHSLAALAVFRELYDTQNDIYGVISKFLTGIIISKKLTSFNLTQITNILNDSYEFGIPEAVIRTSLNRLKFLHKVHYDYQVKDFASVELSSDFKEMFSDITKDNNSILDDLVVYINKKSNAKLTTSEEDNLKHAFYSYLLDKSNGQAYRELISAFIVENQNNADFKIQLNKIHEGIILYTGLMYTNNINEIGTWKTDFTIYLDTEILFSYAGYNGELFKSQFDELHNYIKEINARAKKPLITLRYFQSIKNEIEGFFTKAEYIVSGQGSISPDATAMYSILKNCVTKSDVIEKKSDFYHLLEISGIREEYIEKNIDDADFEFNILDEGIVKQISAELNTNILEYLDNLNTVSLKRKHRNANSFDKVGFIFLTGNSKTLSIAWHNLVKRDGFVPLATSLHFCINKFWFLLNKGFGDNSFPKSLNVLNRAQIILCKELNSSLKDKYAQIKKQFDSGELDEDQVKARILYLRNNVRKPEEINADDVSAILDVMSEDSLTKFSRMQEYERRKSDMIQNENENLKEQLVKAKDEIVSAKIEKENMASLMTQELIDSKEKQLDLASKLLHKRG
jgi:hypothetical protein